MKFCSLLLLLFALTTLALGQSTSPQTLPGYDSDATTTTIIKTVNEVNLVFTVTDKHGGKTVSTVLEEVRKPHEFVTITS